MPPLDSLFYFLWWGGRDTLNGTQELLLTVHSGITLGDHSGELMWLAVYKTSTLPAAPYFFTEYLSEHIELREWKFPFLMLVLLKSTTDN